MRTRARNTIKKQLLLVQHKLLQQNNNGQGAQGQQMDQGQWHPSSPADHMLTHSWRPWKALSADNTLEDKHFCFTE